MSRLGQAESRGGIDGGFEDFARGLTDITDKDAS